MSTQDFGTIAKVFRGTKPGDAGPRFGAWLHIVLAMANELSMTTPDFKRDRFLADSGVEMVD